VLGRGERMVWAWLRYKEHRLINKKRVLRLMQIHHLAVKPNERLKAKRTPEVSKPKPTQPNPWWGIDRPKVLTPSGWVYIVMVLDWHTKKIVGYYAGFQATTNDWLLALDQAVKTQFPEDTRGMGRHWMSDNASQPTSTAWIKACGLPAGIQGAFTRYNNSKGHADTERHMRTMKEE